MMKPLDLYAFHEVNQTAAFCVLKQHAQSEHPM
jgi:hypothetical protein